jgi:hypothetical protein
LKESKTELRCILDDFFFHWIFIKFLFDFLCMLIELKEMIFWTTVIPNNSCAQLLFSATIIFKLYYFYNTFIICVIFLKILWNPVRILNFLEEVICDLNSRSHKFGTILQKIFVFIMNIIPSRIILQEFQNNDPHGRCTNSNFGHDLLTFMSKTLTGQARML